jgi:hypothetical protein
MPTGQNILQSTAKITIKYVHLRNTIILIAQYLKNSADKIIKFMLHFSTMNKN